jgi:hypothetical protein
MLIVVTTRLHDIPTFADRLRVAADLSFAADSRCPALRPHRP